MSRDVSKCCSGGVHISLWPVIQKGKGTWPGKSTPSIRPTAQGDACVSGWAGSLPTGLSSCCNDALFTLMLCLHLAAHQPVTMETNPEVRLCAARSQHRAPVGCPPCVLQCWLSLSFPCHPFTHAAMGEGMARDLICTRGTCPVPSPATGSVWACRAHSTVVWRAGVRNLGTGMRMAFPLAAAILNNSLKQPLMNQI